MILFWEFSCGPALYNKLLSRDRVSRTGPDVISTNFRLPKAFYCPFLFFFFFFFLFFKFFLCQECWKKLIFPVNQPPPQKKTICQTTSAETQDLVSCQTEERWEVFKKDCLSAENVSLRLNSLYAGGAHQAMHWGTAPHDEVSSLLNSEFLSVEWNWIHEKDLFASMCVTEESGVFHCQTRTRWPSLCQPWFRAKLR